MNAMTVFVTGTSSGFGRLTTRSLLLKGHTVLAAMRDTGGRNAPQAAALTDFASRTRGTCHVIELDVGSDSSVDRAVEVALDREPRIDVLINNAGIGIRGLAEAVPAEQLAAILNVNVLGPQRMCRAVLPHMRSNGSGFLVFVTSIMGRMVIPFAGPYTASKFALEGLAETYRYELAPSGIDVAIVEPGGFGTGFRANMRQAEDLERADSYGLLRERQLRLWKNITDRYQRKGGPDPQIVADAIVDLVDLPPGRRPLRTVIDPSSGGMPLDDINAACARVQEQVLSAMGLADLLFPLRERDADEPD